MNGPALAAAIGGPVVGLAGVYFGWLTARGQREHAERLTRSQHEHERELARDARLGAELREAYEHLLKFVFLVEEWVDRTHPLVGPMPLPPAMPPEEERRHTMTRVSVVGSEAVMDKLDEVWAAQREFAGHAHALDALREGHQATGQVPQDVQSAREAFRERVRELEQIIRVEVRA